MDTKSILVYGMNYGTRVMKYQSSNRSNIYLGLDILVGCNTQLTTLFYIFRVLGVSHTHANVWTNVFFIFKLSFVYL